MPPGPTGSKARLQQTRGHRASSAARFDGLRHWEVETLPKHELAGFLEPYLLLELQRAHGGDRFEVVVKARHAHIQSPGDVVHLKRLVKLPTKPFDSPGDAVVVAALERNVAENDAKDREGHGVTGHSSRVLADVQ